MLPQEVSRLEVSVNDVGRVEGFEATQDLKDEQTNMLFGHRKSGLDSMAKVCVHEFLRNVQLVEISRCGHQNVANICNL